MSGLNPEAPVLDHGLVQLINVMGSDADIARAARVSYGKRGKATTQEEDEHLLRFMLRNGHTSPFEQATLTFRLKVPIFVARQFHRHRTQSINEISGRYAELPEEFYVPHSAQIMLQSQSNKQGREGDLADAEDVCAMMEQVQRQAFAVYHALLKKGVAREIARMVLPLATYTEYVTTMNLHNLLHFLRLRTDEHAQWEAREYAWAMLHAAEQHFPATFRAWGEYVQGGVRLSATEAAWVREAAEEVVHIDPRPPVLKGRELTEFRTKMLPFHEPFPAENAK